jgi:hypothetical protein
VISYKCHPVIELVTVPAPAPFAVREFAISGLADVFQHTPLTVMVAPPSEDIFPPPVAVVCINFEPG